MKKNVDSIGKEKMTDQELSQAFGRYQRRESIGILLGALLVIAGCISAFVQHNLLLVCILAFAGVGLILLLALPAQKKKKALMEQQMGGFFRTELTRAFGPEPQTPELPIDYTYLKKVKLLACPWEQATITEFHEGEYKGMRFSAANAEIQHIIEERSGPDNDNWMNRTETVFRGVIVRCKGICDPALDIAIRDLYQERKQKDVTDPAVFSWYFSARTADGQEADALVTPQLRELVQKLENASSNAKVGCLILRGGDLILALNTRYVFAGIPPELDMRDIDGIRKWFTASLAGMGGLLDILLESPALNGTEK